MKQEMKKLLATGAVAVAALGVFSGVAHAGGVVTQGSFCGTSNENVEHAQANINPNVFKASTVCMRNNGPTQDRASGFQMTRFSGGPYGKIVAYPNIFTGSEWGRVPSRGFMPVQAKRTSLSAHVNWGGNIGKAHTAFDLWFNKTDISPYNLRQANGAEVMIWYTGNRSHRGPVIDGHHYGFTWWWAKHNGVRWPLIVFNYQDGGKSSFNGYLKPFLAYASRHAPMSMNYWLTTVAFGSEMMAGVTHGANFHVSNFVVAGIPTMGRQTRGFTSTASWTARHTVRSYKWGVTYAATATASARATKYATVTGYIWKTGTSATLARQAAAKAAAAAALPLARKRAAQAATKAANAGLAAAIQRVKAQQ